MDGIKLLKNIWLGTLLTGMVGAYANKQDNIKKILNMLYREVELSKEAYNNGQTSLDIALEKRAAISDNDLDCKDKRNEYDQIIAFLRAHGAVGGHSRGNSGNEDEAQNRAEESEPEIEYGKN
jgi:hypothetical protein